MPTRLIAKVGRPSRGPAIWKTGGLRGLYAPPPPPRCCSSRASLTRPGSWIRPVRTEDDLARGVRSRSQIDDRAQMAIDVDLRAPLADALLGNPRDVAAGEGEPGEGPGVRRGVERTVERTWIRLDQPCPAICR